MSPPLAWLSADGKKLLVTRILRTFAYGYLTVVIAIYLARLGLDTIQVGLVLSAAIFGSALMTVLWALAADRYGRRRTVATMAVLMIAGGLLFALGSSFPVLLLGAFTGTISATSSEVVAFLTVEQAILPQTAPPERRTWLFSIYAFVANIAQAVGSLFAGVVAAFAALGLAGADAYRPLFLIYAVIGLLNLVIFLSLSDKVEAARVEVDRSAAEPAVRRRRVPPLEAPAGAARRLDGRSAVLPLGRQPSPGACEGSRAPSAGSHPP